jgi:hypothetical protein
MKTKAIVLGICLLLITGCNFVVEDNYEVQKDGSVDFLINTTADSSESVFYLLNLLEDEDILYTRQGNSVLLESDGFGIESKVNEGIFFNRYTFKYTPRWSEADRRDMQSLISGSSRISMPGKIKTYPDSCSVEKGIAICDLYGDTQRTLESWCFKWFC